MSRTQIRSRAFPIPWLRFFHTARHLRPVQWTNRLKRTLRPLQHLPVLPGEVVLLERRPSLPCRSFGECYDGRSFLFLNRRIPFAGPERWAPAGAERLWIYHLHYFQYLHALPPAEGLRMLQDWMACNDDPAGPGWEPYVLSLRIREWLEWLQAHPDLPKTEREAIIRSLAIQAQALLSQVEYHLQGNHLLENAITLCWAGLSLRGAWAEAWLRAGQRLLARETGRQVLSDGVHEERSPMYQALLAEALLRLSEVASGMQEPRATEVSEMACRAGKALAASLGQLVHPDGDIALLNDSALGAAPTPEALARRFTLPLCPTPPKDAVPWALPAGGYWGIRGEGTYLIFDAGPLGPDHQPGHGHADTLSFELAHRGQRLVTDTGVFTYEVGEARAYDRGTAAHNTVQVDGGDQAELWAAFRCGRRPRVLGGRAVKGVGDWTSMGEIVAPRRTLASYRHRRQVQWKSGRLQFRDQLRARGSHRLAVRLHLAPGVHARRTDRGWELYDGTRSLAFLEGEGFPWLETRSPYHPAFGVEVERTALVAETLFQGRVELVWNLRLV